MRFSFLNLTRKNNVEYEVAPLYQIERNPNVPQLPLSVMLNITSYVNDRRTFNHLTLACKDLRSLTSDNSGLEFSRRQRGTIPPPWPCTRFFKPKASARWVTCAKFSPDDQMLAVAAGPVKFWNRQLGQIVSRGNNNVRNTSSLTLGFVGNDHLVTASKRTLSVWNLREDGVEECQAPLKKPVVQMLIHMMSCNSSGEPSSTLVITWGYHGILELWLLSADRRSIQLDVTIDLDQLDGASSEVVSVSPCGTMIAYCRNNYVVDIKKLELGSNGDGEDDGASKISFQNLFSVQTENRQAPYTLVRFAPDGKTLLLGSEDGTLLFYSIETKRRVHDMVIKKNKCINCIAFCDLMVAVGCGSKIYLFRRGDLDRYDTLFFDRTLRGHSDRIESLDFTRDGRNLVSAGDKTFIIWDVHSMDALSSV
ncbi:unnamed protein product [Cylindrotheca closterium]|uniref:Anaphase-promoting complex subunit 4-like WD40 domain-containing protein n=1 Tax=Cylindrotheca closterium TaxID=2856 RepID=A0AAD2PY36_9STRA|nr:unnamed protein product [Cylindrotheca closterium]